MTTHRRKLSLINEGLKKYKCEVCEREEWNNLPIPIELHHIDGDNNNNALSNLMIICPNCHAQTMSYKSKNRKVVKHGEQIGDEELIEKINNSNNISEILRVFNIKRSPHFRNRCKTLISSGLAMLKPAEPKKGIYKKKEAKKEAKKEKKTYHCIDCDCEVSRNSSRCNNCRFIRCESIIAPSKDILIHEINKMGYWKVGAKYGVSDNAVRKWIKSYGLDPKNIRYEKYIRTGSVTER